MQLTNPLQCDKKGLLDQIFRRWNTASQAQCVPEQWVVARRDQLLDECSTLFRIHTASRCSDARSPSPIPQFRLRDEKLHVSPADFDFRSGTAVLWSSPLMLLT